MKTAEERLGALERSVHEIRVRLAMEVPSTEGLTEEEIAERQRRGLLPVGVASLGAAVPPHQTSHSQLTAQLEKIARAQQQGPLTLEEARMRYPDESVPVYLPASVQLIDTEEFLRIQCPKGWQRIPERFLSQLDGRAQIVPEEMR